MSGWGLGVWGSPNFGWGGISIRTGSGVLNASHATITADAALPVHGSGILVAMRALVSANAGRLYVADPIYLAAQPVTITALAPFVAFGVITVDPVFVLNDYPGLDIGYGRFSAGPSAFLHDGPYQSVWGPDPVVWEDPTVWGFGAGYVHRMSSGVLDAGEAELTGTGVRASVGTGEFVLEPAGISGTSHVRRYASGELTVGQAEMEGYAFRWAFASGELQAQPVCGFTYWIKFNKQRKSNWVPVDDRQPNVCSGGRNA
jgi:hypothetical protein